MEKFISNKGAVVEVEQIEKQKWQWHFVGSNLFFVGARTKFQALLEASSKMRKSMKSLHWTKPKDGEGD